MKRATSWLLAKNRTFGIRPNRFVEHLKGGLALEALVSLVTYAAVAAFIALVARVLRRKKRSNWRV